MPSQDSPSNALTPKSTEHLAASDINPVSHALSLSFETVPKILCTPGARHGLIDEFIRLGVSKLLIVTDKGLMQTGLVQPIVDALSVQLDVALYTDVEVDPPQERVEAAIDFARAQDVDGVLGLGGGSSMDTAKLIALLTQSEQTIDEVYGVNMAKGSRLPMILVPTTAGTGSEATTIAIVTTPSHEKKGVVSPLLLPDVAVLDAELILDLPAPLSAMTGIDAMVHAIESYTSCLKKNPLTDAIAMQAFCLLYHNLELSLADGRNIEARSAMLLGACLGGIAIANAPVGAVHALAYPLGGLFHMPHGHSNAVVLPGVLAFNAPAAQREYAALARAIMPETVVLSDADACQKFIETMTALVARMPFSQRLSDSGVTESDVERLAADAMNVTRLLQNNPREMTFEAAAAIYRAIL